MLASGFIRTFYRNIVKPVLFHFDAELVHDFHSSMGEFLGSYSLTRGIVKSVFVYEDPSLVQNMKDFGLKPEVSSFLAGGSEQSEFHPRAEAHGFPAAKINGVRYINPVGLSAGFDYDGHMAEIMSGVGFGFNTVGTVTAKYYEGNKKPRLARLPKSKSLFVNKGFKSGGCERVAERLDGMSLMDKTVGISVGSSNLPEVDSIEKAVADYTTTFEIFRERKYVKYFELNISCPNTLLPEPFTDKNNLELLLKEVGKLKIVQPIYIKMPSEIEESMAFELIDCSLNNGVNGFIFSNLVKDRSNKYLDRGELEKLAGLKGNFSGRPTGENSNRLIKSVRSRYGKDVVIIGCGGIFDAIGAYEKLKMGANLVQLISGMIFEGPQLIGEINRDLVRLMKKDGLAGVSEISRFW